MYRADIELLNNAMDRSGQTALQKRSLDQQKQRDIEEALLRRQMEQNQQQHYTAEDDFRKAQLGHYQQLEAKQDQANDINQKRLDLQDEEKMLGTIIQLNAGGMLDDKTRTAVNSYLAKHPHFGQTGIQLTTPPQKPPPQAGQNAQAQAYTIAEQFREKAKALQAQGAGNYDPDEADRLIDKANKLDQWAPASEDVIEKQDYEAEPPNPGSPAVPPSSGFFGIGAHPGTNAVPATPGLPKRTVTIKHPPGWTPTTIPGTNAPSVPPVGTVSKGYRFKGGDPGNRQNWEEVQ